MTLLRRLLRLLLVWWLPFLLAMVFVAGGLFAWLAATQQGTALLLRMAAAQFGGQAEDVRGTLLGGVRVGSLSLALPGTEIDARGLNLDVDWRALSHRVLRVRDLSADALRVALTSGTPDSRAESAAPAPPALPVEVAVDRLALGRFELEQDGRPLPVALGDFQATLALGEPGLRLDVASLRVGHELAETGVQGRVRLDRLAGPWPMDVHLLASVHGPTPQSPVCVQGWLPGGAGAAGAAPDAARAQSAAKPGAGQQGRGGGQAAQKPEAPAEPPPGCTVLLDLSVQGSLEDMRVALAGDGDGLALRAHADAAPQADIPLRRADLDLRLADGSSLAAKLDWQEAEAAEGRPAGQDAAAGRAAADAAQGENAAQVKDGAAGAAAAPPRRERLRGSLASRKLDLGRLLAGAIPPAVLSATLDFDAEIVDRATLAAASLDLALDEGSRWNGQPLSGTLAARVQGEAGSAGGVTADWTRLHLPRLDADLRLGGNRVRAQGGWGDPGAALTLDVLAPRLAAFWPDLPGGATLKARLSGTAARHEAELDAAYTPPDLRQGLVGRDRASARVALAGGWGPGAQGAFQAGATGWRGTVAVLDAAHAGYRARTAAPLAVAFLPGAAAPQWQWQVGRGRLDLGLPGDTQQALEHEGSRGGGGRWETAGRASGIVVTGALVRAVRRTLDPDFDADARPRASRANGGAMAAQRRIALDASWDLAFAGTLTGRARIERRDGDLRIPGDPPIPLGLERLALEVRAARAGASSSRLDATLDVATARMGTVAGSASAVLAVGADGAMALAPRQPVRVGLRADVADLAWVGLFTGDAFEVGGSLRADVDAQGVPGGDWQARGTVRGESLRVVRIDDGVRLLDGTLSARLEDQRVILESLRFPASLRVIPSEWRTREWITTNPDAQGGEIRASGQWDLSASAGAVQVVLHRFPALQRSDRYAMVSGKVDIKADLPSLSIVGDLTADAGWASLEILSGVPTLDDDVVVVRAGQEVQAPSAMKVFMDLGVDLGPRFYLTGMGLDSGLVGNMRIRLDQGRLTGNGVLRTRGGRFEAYGQRLHLRRGTITFQDSLENPLLDIEALRLGEQVEAGVRIGGSAQRPRIDLVSYPDVSEVEKLSWLILGRGPDESGSDAALLLSVGAALLGGGEPFYRQFGLDDLGIKSGAMGRSGSLLPDNTVASNVTRNSASELETQFLVASKRLANGITLSIEQGLAGAETVGRASYRLSRRWSVDLKGGAVNGLELVYRTFWDD